MNMLWLVHNEKLSLDSVVNNGKPQSLFSKKLKSEILFCCDKWTRLGRGRHKICRKELSNSCNHPGWHEVTRTQTRVMWRGRGGQRGHSWHYSQKIHRSWWQDGENTGFPRHDPYPHTTNAVLCMAPVALEFATSQMCGSGGVQQRHLPVGDERPKNCGLTLKQHTIRNKKWRTCPITERRFFREKGALPINNDILDKQFIFSGTQRPGL